MPPTETPDASDIDPCDIPVWSGAQGSAGAVLPAASQNNYVVQPARLSLVAIGSFENLVWASNWIVTGKIVAECDNPDPWLGTDYVIAVDQTLRGTSEEHFIVSGLSDEYSVAEPLKAGDSVALLLLAPEVIGGIERIFSLGGPQGYFPIVDGLAINAIAPFSVTVDELGLAVSAVLDSGPPDNPPLPALSLNRAPRGPDLPPAGSPTASGCGGTVDQGSVPSRSVAIDVWTSHAVFIGEVIEAAPATRVEPGDWLDMTFMRPLVTDYTVRVDTSVRGLGAETIRVRELGGTVSDCVLAGPDIAVDQGDKLLIFAWTPEPGSAEPTYYALNGVAASWSLSDDGVFLVHDTGTHGVAEAVPLFDMFSGMLARLSGDPPDPGDAWEAPSGVISLDVSPAAQDVPESVQPLVTPPDWTRWESDQTGTAVSHPADWHVAGSQDQPGVTSFANYPTDGGSWEEIPAGGVRVDIGVRGQAADSFDIPILVGQPGYPGSIGFFGLTGDTYHVVIAYEAGGEWRSVAAYFKEPAELSNPNLRTFFSIVASLVEEP